MLTFKLITNQFPEVVADLNQGLSLRATAKETGWSINTIRKVKAAQHHEAS